VSNSKNDNLMKVKFSKIIQFIFAFALLFFGGNKLFQFVLPPPAPEVAWVYWDALNSSKTISLVAFVEIIAGLSLLFSKYTALTMLVLMSVSVNAVLYHLTLDLKGIPMALVLIVLNSYMLYENRHAYKDIIKV
jgi:putative oxidoreductase